MRPSCAGGMRAEGPRGGGAPPRVPISPRSEPFCPAEAAVAPRCPATGSWCWGGPAAEAAGVRGYPGPARISRPRAACGAVRRVRLGGCATGAGRRRGASLRHGDRPSPRGGGAAPGLRGEAAPLGAPAVNGGTRSSALGGEKGKVGS